MTDPSAIMNCVWCRTAHGGPRCDPPFTPEDVKQLTDLAGLWDGQAEYSEKHADISDDDDDESMWRLNAGGCRAWAKFLRALALRIQNLLPPAK